MKVYTGDEILTSIYNLGMLPNVEADGSDDATLLRHASEAIREDLAPSLHAVNEEYFVRRKRATISATQTRYRLPTRAMWDKLRHARLASGSSDSYGVLDVKDVSDEDDLLNRGDCYLEGNYFVLLHPDSGFELEFHYFHRPGDLVKTTAARQVASFTDPGGGNTRVNFTNSGALPTGWTTGIKFDAHSEDSGADVRFFDLAAAGAADGYLDFPATSIDGSTVGEFPLVVGDWVCLAGECAVIALPQEWGPAIARAACVRYLEATDDMARSQIHAAHLSGIVGRQVKSSETRVESKPLRVRGLRGPIYAGRRWGVR